MQLMILDAETTIAIQSKMSEINEETVDEKFVKSVPENFSDDLPETKGDNLTNTTLIGIDKDKEILDNDVLKDETNNKPGSNDNLTAIQTLPIEYNSSNRENEKSSDIFDNNFSEKQNIVVAEDNENSVVVIENTETDESDKLDLSSEIILLNENSNNEAILKSDDKSNVLDDDINELDLNLSKLSESTKDVTNSNTKSKDVDVKDDYTEEIEDKNKCVIETELDNKLDDDANSKNDEEQNKNGKIETNNQDDSKLNDECNNSVKGNDEKENSPSDKENSPTKDKQDGDVKDTKVICTIDKGDSLTKNMKDSLTKDEYSLTESAVDSLTKDENDTCLTNKEENFSKDKESSLTNNKKDSPMADKENNITNNSEDSLMKNEEDTLRNDKEESPIKGKEDDLAKHKESSLKKDKKDGPPKGQEDALTTDIKDSLTKNEKDNFTKDIEDEDVISKSPIDINFQSNNESNHSEISEKDIMKEKSDDKNDSIRRKSFCTENRTVEQKDNDNKTNDKGNDNKTDKNEIPAKKSKKSIASKLSNTLDILSDDEDTEEVLKNNENMNSNDGSISLVDDDDIMLIEEDIEEKKESDTIMSEPSLEVTDVSNIQNQCSLSVDINETKMEHEAVFQENCEKKDIDCSQNVPSKIAAVKPLLPSNFLKTCKKNLADMTREDLEEFCILKIVESVIDRSSLGDVKAQLKTMAHTVEEYKKKFMVVARQSRDLQLVLKSIQEEQKKPSVYPITPLKITRSVGMQVFMTDQPFGKKRQQILTPTNNLPLDKSIRNNTNAKPQKNNQQIPVPRLVPAATPTSKASSTAQTTVNNVAKPPQTNNSLVNGIKNSPAPKPEKRTRVQSVTVDLTDDEPPPKIATKSSPVPPVRLIQPQNLMPPQRQPYAPNINSPRKVYIPIGSPQSQNVRPGHTILLKPVPPNPGLRQRGPMNSLAKMQSNPIRMNRVQSARHPAPLPEALKQYQPSNWKALPPPPDLKLSKVDNGIVISWKIEGYEEDSYEEITSYQLYAYQEAPGPPSTALWKKIGDVKALPLPMACTLTQFMAGYKYYFAVRAIDVKSRIGPFSIPGSIILLNKM